jgi:predicted nucleotidyltransferase
MANIRRVRAHSAVDPFLSQLVDLIVAEFSPRKVLLFGSRARRTNGPESDYDILIVTSRAVGWQRRLRFERRRSDAELSKATDMVFWTAKYFAERSQLPNSFASEIKAQGEVLYEIA